MKLGELKGAPGSRHKTKRIGRGPASGHGKTSGRGHKGQKARASGHVRRGFEGGQMPLARRLPKRGFKNVWNKAKDTTAAVNVGVLGRFSAGATVDLESLAAQKMIRAKGARFLRVLGNGELKAALTVRAHHFTAQAKAKIEAAGGRAEVI